jgi:hypothetical protein
LIPDDPAHDVVKKCRNGRLLKPVDDVYVIIRINLEGDCPDADALAHSYDPDFGSKFVEQIACREIYGRFWDYDKEGTPCFDPYTDDGEGMRPFPSGMFMMWDIEDDSDDPSTGVPKVAVPSLTIYGEGPEHKPMRRYKVAKTQLTIQDLMAIETDGDRFFTK